MERGRCLESLVRCVRKGEMKKMNIENITNKEVLEAIRMVEGYLDNEKEIKDKLLKLFEEIDRQSDEYIQELRQRLSLAEKVCYAANGYLKSKDNPLGRIYLDRLAEALEKWDNSRENKGAQYVVMEDWEQC